MLAQMRRAMISSRVIFASNWPENDINISGLMIGVGVKSTGILLALSRKPCWLVTPKGWDAGRPLTMGLIIFAAIGGAIEVLGTLACPADHVIHHKEPPAAAAWQRCH